MDGRGYGHNVICSSTINKEDHSAQMDKLLTEGDPERRHQYGATAGVIFTLDINSRGWNRGNLGGRACSIFPYGYSPFSIVPLSYDVMA